MKEYYIVIDDVKQGSFSIEELRKKDIFASTLIWTEEMEDWTEAYDFEELKDVLKKTPPPIPKQANVENNKSQIKTETKVLLAKEIKINFKLIRNAFIIGLIALPIFFAINDGFYFIEKSRGYKKDLAEEINNPVKYDYHNRRLYQYEHEYEQDYKAFKKKYKEALSKAVFRSIAAIFAAWILIVIGRYITKGVKWVDDTSKEG